MILSRAEAHAILRGAKTQLRRPRAGHAGPPFERDRQVVQYERPRTYEDAPAKHAEDTTVVETVCHIVIRDQRLGLLGEMSDADARAEGFTASKGLTALNAFRKAWAEQHGEFRPSDEVWVARFDVERDERPRYLARGAGYTESPHMAIDDLAAVPPSEVDAINARRARTPSPAVLRALAQREARARAARLRDLERKATVRGIDIKAELEALDRYLEEMRRKVDRG